MNSIEMQSRYDIRIRINLCENVERNFLSTKKTRGTVRLKILKNGGIKNMCPGGFTITTKAKIRIF